MKKDQIKIIDWAGRILFEGHYNSKQVDKVLEANYCDCKKRRIEAEEKESFYQTDADMEYCDNCDQTGYSGDFHAEWAYPELNEDRNIYEWINY
jgi:hypothetical protein